MDPGFRRDDGARPYSSTSTGALVFAVSPLSRRDSSGRSGRGVVGPVSGGRREDGDGVMRAPGNGVARKLEAGTAREAGGGVYQAFVAAISLGQPLGSHGTRMLVER